MNLNGKINIHGLNLCKKMEDKKNIYAVLMLDLYYV